MHQEPHQDACHGHQNGVVVHALQAWGERREGKSCHGLLLQGI